MDALKAANLALRFLLELCAVAAAGYWGLETGQDTLTKAALGIGAPLLVIVVWAIFVSPKALVSLPSPLPTLLGLVVLGLTALALAATGHRTLAIVFAVAIVLNQVLLFL